jgi:quercetin dioxygenase-like cupin family protein
MSGPEEIQILRMDRDYVPIPGRVEVRAIIWPGMGARHRSMHSIRLHAGESSGEWRHPSEAVYYVLAGSGWFHDLTAGTGHGVRCGHIVHVAAGTAYTMTADAFLACIGGPCPPDPALYGEMTA